MVRGNDLLHTVYKFKHDSQLQKYLLKNTGREQKAHTLVQVLMMLKDIIREEKMFDERNPSVIICSKSLEQALDQQALHITEF
jgi:hypothetical protein